VDSDSKGKMKEKNNKEREMCMFVMVQLSWLSKPRSECLLYWSEFWTYQKGNGEVRIR